MVLLRVFAVYLDAFFLLMKMCFISTPCSLGTLFNAISAKLLLLQN